MSIFSEGEKLFGEAEREARAHPDQANKVVAEGEQLAEKETGGRYDSQITGLGSKLEQELEGPNSSN